LSPVVSGGGTLLEQAHNRIARKNPFDIPHFSLPYFSKTFDEHQGITDDALKTQFQNALAVFVKQL
ncbi:MAG: hypothetical protein ACPHT9_04060, partial [Flavobacteriaceae bacterium]